MKLYRVEFGYMNDTLSVHIVCTSVDKVEEYARLTLR